MEKQYIMAFDQGTTGSRVLIIDRNGDIKANAYREIIQLYPQPGWVEHDPIQIWETSMRCVEEVFAKSGIHPAEIAGIGITNQRETTVLWDTDHGQTPAQRHRMAVPPIGSHLRRTEKTWAWRMKFGNAQDLSSTLIFRPPR